MRIMALMCLMTSLQLQAKENRFYVYNAANGLADNSAQTIYCTQSGRLVITTMGQINFFDGHIFLILIPVRRISIRYLTTAVIITCILTVSTISG